MFKRALRKIDKGQKGQVLIIVLILLALGGIILLPTLDYSSTSLNVHRVFELNTLELYAADSGVEDALNWLINGKSTGGPWAWDEASGSGTRAPYPLNDSSVDVSVEEIDTNTYKITSMATSADGHTTVLSTVWAIPFFEDGHEFDNQNPPPPGDIHINGAGTFSNHATVTGNVTATGSIELENHSGIIGNVAVDGNITLGNNTYITGTVCCSGDITIGNHASITGDIRIGEEGKDSTITLEQAGARINGNIWADGNLIIDIVTNAEIVGNIYAPAGNITIYLRKPNSLITGDIYASGSIQIVEGTINGTQHSYYAGDPPFSTPTCPNFPTSPVSTITYEIT